VDDFCYWLTGNRMALVVGQLEVFDHRIFAIVLGTVFLDVLFEVIVAVLQGQTCPTALDHFKKPDGNNILCPGIFRLILFGRVIKYIGTTKDIPACFGVDKIIRSDK